MLLDSKATVNDLYESCPVLYRSPNPTVEFCSNRSRINGVYANGWDVFHILTKVDSRKIVAPFNSFGRRFYCRALIYYWSDEHSTFLSYMKTCRSIQAPVCENDIGCNMSYSLLWLIIPFNRRYSISLTKKALIRNNVIYPQKNLFHSAES